MGLKSFIFSQGLKSALSGGGLPILLIGGAIAFASGSAVTWKVTDTIAKANQVKAIKAREDKLKADHAQKVTDLNGKLTAERASVKLLKAQVSEAAEARKEQNKSFNKGNAKLRADFKTLKDKIENLEGDFYEMQIPDDAVDILNCSFGLILCDKFGNPVIAGADPAQNFQGYDQGKADYRRNPANPPAKN